MEVNLLKNDILSLYKDKEIGNILGVEDWVDYLNFSYTVVFFLFGSLIIATGNFFFKTISCYMPTEVEGSSFSDYVENFCWIEGTSIPPYNESIPQSMEEWQSLNVTNRIAYYQWVPFMFGLQAVFFYLPRIAWQSVLRYRLGIDIRSLMKKVNETLKAKSSEDEEKRVMFIAKKLYIMLLGQHFKVKDSTSRFSGYLLKMIKVGVPSKRTGNWIVFSYICMKLIYFANCILQLWLMQTFLGRQESPWLYGQNIIINTIFGNMDKLSYFPLTTLCSVPLRHLGASDNVYSGTCVLPMNLFNEKIFTFFFIWIYYVSLVTALSIPWWLIRSIYSQRQDFLILKLLLCPRVEIVKKDKNCAKNGGTIELQPVKDESSSYEEKQNTQPSSEKVQDQPRSSQLAKDHKQYEMLYKQRETIDKKQVDEFLRSVLSYDGIMLLRFIRLQAGGVLTSKILCRLWDLYHQPPKELIKSFSTP